jgi:hypothetical protein
MEDQAEKARDASLLAPLPRRVSLVASGGPHHAITCVTLLL